MSSVWQKIKTASGSGTQQTVTFVSQVLNRRYYKYLDKDNDDDVFGNEIQPETPESANAENEDDVDDGIGQRQKYLLTMAEPITTTAAAILENTVDSEHSQDVITCENSQNEIKDLSSKYSVIHQPVVPSIPAAHRNTDSCDLTVNTWTESCQTEPVRRRRDSYDKALSEMRESYDRVFTEIVDYSQNTPAVLSVDVPQETVGVDVIRPDELTQNSPGIESNGDIDLSKGQSSPKPPLHRQISSVLQKDIPAALQIIRNRNYSKLDDDGIIEIEDTPVSKEDTSNTDWQDSFQVEAKTKSKGRKRSKKVWKKTKKAARVAFKWLRRSIVTFGSSYNYGVPITVAMYGGSNRNRRRRGYDYR